MGYKPKSERFTLELEEYPGLEVTCRGTSMGKLFELAKVNVKVNEQDEEKKLFVFKFFAQRVITWNVDHPEPEDTLTTSINENGVWRDEVTCARCGLTEDAPLPTDYKYFECLELTFIMEIIFGWMNAISRVAGPKGMNSKNGANGFQEELMRRLGELQSL